MQVLSITDPLNKLGIYLHYPFCVKECFYCDFFKLTNFRRSFYDDIIKDIDFKIRILKDKGYFFNKKVDSIYFGGGTPSLMSINSLFTILQKIFYNFNVSHKVEITLEANPDNLNLRFIKDIKNLGINRISIGIQTFSLFGLRVMGRIHDPSTLTQTIHSLEKNFENYNLDFLCLYPYQTIDSLKNDLKIINSIKPPHLSYYLIDIDKKTLYTPSVLKKIKKQYLESDLFYDLICEELSKDYDHYEISNFTLKNSNFYCKHNIKYWYYADYIGFGNSAVSKITLKNKTFRFENPLNGCQGDLVSVEEIDYDMEIFEKLMLALRTKWGIVVNSKNIKISNFKNYSIEALNLIEWVRHLT
jgi:oxygen-independent coproporphyrinogen-3 oxidase